ncbi:hypothetical protein ATANTOWER_027372 [Ataeniobius toweri]|uniref:Uncharacterized protein n=1 Tax=Ataeniobius toweri TaxID=208326 RepID=A0ABU7B9M6_9TELE|nr:hypothetical protein [Ataeniobius toweri]
MSLQQLKMVLSSLYDHQMLVCMPDNVGSMVLMKMTDVLGYLLPDPILTHHHTMLNNAAGSITITAASSDPFISVTGAQSEPALIFEKNRALSIQKYFIIPKGKLNVVVAHYEGFFKEPL